MESESKELVVTGEILDDNERTEWDAVMQDADEKNSQQMAQDLQTLGDDYEEAQRRVEEGKLEMKSLVEQGKAIGITKGMIETYIAMKNLNELNKFAVMGAINEK